MKDPRRDALRTRKILDMFRQTGSIRATVRRLQISIKVVRRVLRGKPIRKPIRTPRKQPSKLEPYRGLIEHLVIEKRHTAVLVLEALRDLGYTGGYSILKDWVRAIRPSSVKRPTTVIEHPPGEEGQMDWSPYSVVLGTQQRVAYGFSMVLPFSRYMFLRFTLDETLDTVIRLHAEAFDDIGAVPRKMTYDNMTTVGRHVGPGDVWLNPRFEAWAVPYKFKIHILPPGKPNLHASVERPFHYVENNFLLRHDREFPSLDDLNQKAAWWCVHRANVREHGTTREHPIDRLVRERPLMLPLPGTAPELFETLERKVNPDFCVLAETNRYSVDPCHIGKKAVVHLFAERLEVYISGQLAAVHCRDTDGNRKRHVLPEHEEAYKHVTPQRALLESAFQRLGAVAKDYYEGLRSQRGSGAGYHLQRLLKLADRYSSSVVVAAMAHAARYGNYSAEAVTRVIAGRQIKRAAGSPAALAEPVPMPSEQVKAWLEAMVVETGDLADYDKKIDQVDRDRIAGKGGPVASEPEPRDDATPAALDATEQPEEE